jgi:hypothetical protein
MAEEEEDNILRERGKLIHKIFKCKFWDTGVIGKGCCGVSLTRSKKEKYKYTEKL